MRTRIRIQVPPASSSGGSGGGSAGISGPYISQTLQPFPTGDGVTFVFSIYGLGEADEVTWSASLGEFDYVEQDIYDAHTLVLIYRGGDGGSVTATVNGEVIGSAAYSAP